MIIAEVQQLAAQLKSASDQITNLIGALNGQVQQVTWWGVDHDQFVSDFNAQIPTLHGVATTLQDFSGRATRNAQQQWDAEHSG
jgi:hypothetical protein